MFRPLSLPELAADYLSARDVCPRYARGFAHKVSAFCEWSGSTSPDCLSEGRLNDYLRSLRAAGRSPATVRNHRNDLLVLWRWLADAGQVPQPAAREVMAVRVPYSVPDCWMLDEVRALLSAAESLAGDLPNGVPAAAYWSAAIRVGWETGLRLGDMQRLKMSQLSGCQLVTVASKTGQRQIHTLTADCVGSLEALDRPVPLAWPYRPNRFGIHFERLRKAAGVRRGTWKWFRRASGSYVAAKHGEAAGAAHLGHTSVATFRKFYDARLVAEARPMPPKL